MSHKKQLLDPISTVCKIIALNFMEINTKIGINDHILCLQEPSIYQSITRFYKGDSKENIYDLSPAIIRTIEWYLIKNTSEINSNSYKISQSKEIHKLINYLCKSFKKLQKTYKNGNVVNSIQFYINILNDCLTGSIITLENLNSRLPTGSSDDTESPENLLDYNKIKNFWTQEKLKIICDLYDNCFKVNDDIILPPEEKYGFIDSYLKSIFSILSITDKDFQKLITNCDNG